MCHLVSIWAEQGKYGAMKRIFAFTLCLIMGSVALMWLPPVQGHPYLRAAGSACAEDFRPMPFHELARRVGERYRGRLIGAEIMRPSPHERDLGAALIYEFRLITPQQNLLRIRMDARDGRFMEIAGRGQLQALRKNDASPARPTRTRDTD